MIGACSRVVWHSRPYRLFPLALQVTGFYKCRTQHLSPNFYGRSDSYEIYDILDTHRQFAIQNFYPRVRVLYACNLPYSRESAIAPRPYLSLYHAYIQPAVWTDYYGHTNSVNMGDWNPNRGNVAGSFNNFITSMTDERPEFMRWLSPLEPQNRHESVLYSSTVRANRLNRVGNWLLEAN